MSFFCTRLAPSSTPAALTAVNLFSNHVSKTASVFDIVFKRDLGIYSVDTPSGHPFTRVAAENDEPEKDSTAECGGVPCAGTSSSTSVPPSLEDVAVPTHALCSLCDIEGVVTAMKGSLVFIPTAKAKPAEGVSNTAADKQQQHVTLSQALPSGHHIVALTRLGTNSVNHSEAEEAKVGAKRSRDEPQDESSKADDSFLVADAVGNVYLIASAFRAISVSVEDGEVKTTKTVSCEDKAAPKALLAEPTLIVSSSDVEPMCGALPAYSLGVAGWVGITILSNNRNSGNVIFAVGRENARDVRVVHFNTKSVKEQKKSSKVIGCFFSTHAPTSMALLRAPGGSSNVGWEMLLAVANGPLISCYDVAFNAAEAHVVALKTTVRSPFTIITHRKNVWSVTSTANTTSLSTGTPALPLGEPYLLWVAGSDRSMSYLDATRGFMRVHTSPNVLKYDAVAGAVVSPSDAFATGGGTQSLLPSHVAVSGVDCEVRCIAHHEQRFITAALKEKDDANRKGGKKEEGEAQKESKSTAVTPATAPDTHNPNSFRGRLNSAIHGDDVWVGVWRSFTAKNGTTFAAGLTRSGTLYVSA